MQVMRIPLRKLHDKLRIALPAEFVRAQGLRPGDYVDLVQDDGNMKLRFVKVEPPLELCSDLESIA
jgi:hypothetical protein